MSSLVNPRVVRRLREGAVQLRGRLISLETTLVQGRDPNHSLHALRRHVDEHAALLDAVLDAIEEDTAGTRP